ncbi:MAG: tRNA (adenosine(37)-N6)-dimethylallyltransferase MiaA [Chitinophagaceae bacterium]
MSSKKFIIQVVGPTAVGKTSLAITLAKHFKTEIISFDSRQCYQELRIGVARPLEEELSEVKHYFIASHSIHEPLNAAWYEEYALQLTKNLFETHQVIVMVGGTGLYWNAFAKGMDPLPAIDPSIRAALVSNYEKNGMDWLVATLLEKDPVFAVAGEMKNPQRMLRALEVVTATGQSILQYRNQEKQVRDFTVISIGIELPRQELVERIHTRVDLMMEQGLLEEVKLLLPFASLNALQTVGYAELFAYLNQEISLTEAVEKIKINTRQYAKRQMTWFKRDPATTWFSPGASQEVLQLIAEKLR